MRTIDWDAARRRLERSRDALERVLEPDPERLAGILRARAERLARPPAADAGERGERALVFRLGGNRYGIDLARVAEVVKAPRCSPVPGGPSALAGVMQLRGRILPVWEFGRLLGRPGTPSDRTGWVLVLHGALQQFGLRVEGVEGIREIDSGQQSGTAEQAAHIRHVTPDSVAVLDMDELLKQIPT